MKISRKKDRELVLSIILLVSLVFTSSCKDSTTFFKCDRCSKLKDISLNRVDEDIFHFSLNYPYGHEVGEKFIPYISLEGHVQIKGDTFFLKIQLLRNIRYSLLLMIRG